MKINTFEDFARYVCFLNPVFHPMAPVHVNH